VNKLTFLVPEATDLVANTELAFEGVTAACGNACFRDDLKIL
jgi:hypothetical protein